MSRSEPLFFNRELSWTEFNARVLAMAMDETVPLLERLKFCAIVSSNFDEFFRVRVSGLKRQAQDGDMLRCLSGLRPTEQLEQLSDRIQELCSQQNTLAKHQLIPALAAQGIHINDIDELEQSDLEAAERYFADTVFPIVTPVRIDDHAHIPFVPNLALHTAVLLTKSSDKESHNEQLALIKVPDNVDRLVQIREYHFVFLEDLIIHCAGSLFPGHHVTESLAFRVTRDADLSVDEERDENFIEAMAEVITQREQSSPVRFEDSDTSETLRDILTNALGIQDMDVYPTLGHLDHTVFMSIAGIPGFDHLRDPLWPPLEPAEFQDDVDIWQRIRRGDILLHHPYDAFTPVVHLVQQAAIDPDVLAIKMTLYRTSGDSPIVQALENAALADKQVTVVVELKARFDEERNIAWARRLEQAGVIVIYGVAHLKVHAKALLIVRRERGGIARYIHLSTGNYNEKTAMLYTDMGIITTQPQLTMETTLFFNAVTGYSSTPELSLLSMAPLTLKRRLLELIEREVQRHSAADSGLIIAKLNSVADPDIIKALYKASCAGVRIRLNVRGICMLVPGVPGMSENIEVVSIIDRFLEHTRIVFFRNGGDREVYLSSADWMPRNLDRRVELMFPVVQDEHREAVEESLSVFFRDNTHSHRLLSNGVYERSQSKGNAPFRAQEHFYNAMQRRKEMREADRRREFTVRRKAPKR